VEAPRAPLAGGSAPAPPAPAERLRAAPESPRLRPLEIPAAVVRAWEQHGFEVHRQQRLVSMELTGGRRLKVPFNEFRVEYVGDRTY
jgi:hypothetical protein